MAFGWPRYLPCLQALPPSFLKTTGKSILDDLKGQSILLSETNEYASPRELIIVTDSFRWNDADPQKRKLLLDFDGQAQKTLSRDYSSDSYEGIKALGLSEMYLRQFFEQYKIFTEHDGGRSFREQSSDWHSRIADIFITSLPSKKKDLLKICRNCCNIPIRDPNLRDQVRWVSMNSEEKIYFKDAKSSRPIPNGLSMAVVDEKVKVDPKRKKFFLELGVQVCNQNKICQKIKDLHNETEGPVIDLETCISHAIYLFNSGDRPDEDDRLHVYDSKGTFVRDTIVYIPFDDDAEIINRWIPSDSPVMNRIHPDYEYAVTKESLKEWLQWLLLWCNLEVWPVLHDNGRLSEPMRYLSKTKRSEGFLQCLRHRFEMDPNITDCVGTDRIALEAEIKCAQVYTEQNGMEMLKDTALPSLLHESVPSLQGEIATSFPILRLDEPTGKGWAFLKTFGVLTELNTDFYQRLLLRFRDMGCCPSNESLKLIYDKLGQLSTGDVAAEENIR